MAGAYYDLGLMDSARYYAQRVVCEFDDADDKVSAYYILHKYAIMNNDIVAADRFAELRMDEKRILELQTIDSLDAIRKIRAYLHYSEIITIRVVCVMFFILLLVSLLILVIFYWKKKTQDVEDKVKAIYQAEEEYRKAIDDRRQQRLCALNQHIHGIRNAHPSPDTKWKEFVTFRQELNQLLFCLLDKLAEKRLSEKEIRLCVYCLLYHDVSTKTLAEYMIYSTVGVRTFKQRTANKLGTTAAKLNDFLIELAVLE